MALLKRAFFVFLFLFVFIQFSKADIVYLKNGREIKGVILSETGDAVQMRIGRGANIVLRKDDIVKIEYIEVEEGLVEEEEVVSRERGIMDLYKVIINSKDKDELVLNLHRFGQTDLDRISRKISIALNIFLNLVFGSIIGLIVLIMCKINKTIPFGIKLARANLLFIVFSMLSFIFIFLIFFLPNMMFLLEPGVMIPFFIVILCQLIFLKIMYWVFVDLAEFNPKARIVQIIFSIIGLLNFPVGTAFNGVILYSLFRKKNKAFFTRSLD